MTIPLYYGTENIGDFFNTDGIITLTKNDFDNMDTVVKKCTPAFYEEHMEAIKENYDRVQEYASLEGYMFKHYGDDLRY